MQVTNQSVPQKNIPKVQYNCNYNCTPAAAPPVENEPAKQQPVQYSYPQNYYIPQAQPQIQQPQNMQIPSSTSGVNIQIFNPSVTPPGAQPPTYNVNAPCYPSNYYTGQLNGQPGNQTPPTSVGPEGTKGAEETGESKDSKETTSSEKTETSDGKQKTEKKKIVQLTDEYIKNLENYLNSQEKDLRLSAAKEVYARLEEDPSRKDDKALTALINKMLQDPSEEIRILALSALQSRIVTGDDFTVGVLTKMQADKSNYGMDAADASKILLQMSGKQVEKEVPVDETAKKKETTKEEKQVEQKSSIKKA